jgi:hypothetical protein
MANVLMLEIICASRDYESLVVGQNFLGTKIIIWLRFLPQECSDYCWPAGAIREDAPAGLCISPA